MNFFFPRSILLGINSICGLCDSKEEFNDASFCSTLVDWGVSFIFFFFLIYQDTSFEIFGYNLNI